MKKIYFLSIIFLLYCNPTYPIFEWLFGSGTSNQIKTEQDLKKLENTVQSLHQAMDTPIKQLIDSEHNQEEQIRLFKAVESACVNQNDCPNTCKKTLDELFIENPDKNAVMQKHTAEWQEFKKNIDDFEQIQKKYQELEKLQLQNVPSSLQYFWNNVSLVFANRHFIANVKVLRHNYKQLLETKQCYVVTKQKAIKQEQKILEMRALLWNKWNLPPEWQYSNIEIDEKINQKKEKLNEKINEINKIFEELLKLKKDITRV